MADEVSNAVSTVKAWYKNLSVYAAGGVGFGAGFLFGLLF